MGTIETSGAFGRNLGAPSHGLFLSWVNPHYQSSLLHWLCGPEGERPWLPHPYHDALLDPDRCCSPRLDSGFCPDQCSLQFMGVALVLECLRGNKVDLVE